MSRPLLCRQFFAGHVMSFGQWKGRKKVFNNSVKLINYLWKDSSWQVWHLWLQMHFQLSLRSAENDVFEPTERLILVTSKVLFCCWPVKFSYRIWQLYTHPTLPAGTGNQEPHVLNVLFIWKVNLEKFCTFPWETVLPRKAIKLQHLIIQFTPFYLSSGCLQEVKNERKFHTFSSKTGWEVVPYKRFQI